VRRGCLNLEENSEAEEDAAEENGHAGRCAGDVDCSSSASGAGATSSRGSGSATKASDGNCRRCGSCSSSRGSRQHGADCGVALVGRLSTAGVISTAGVGAGVVAVAAGDTLIAPLLTDVEGEGLRVFGDVGGDAVLANARVGQGVLEVH
jgi:hypothetical protein